MMDDLLKMLFVPPDIPGQKGPKWEISSSNFVFLKENFSTKAKFSDRQKFMGEARSIGPCALPRH